MKRFWTGFACGAGVVLLFVFLPMVRYELIPSHLRGDLTLQRYDRWTGRVEVNAGVGDIWH
jgi:hypothetical protein